MKLVKLEGYNNIYQASTFIEELDKLFGKNKGEKKKYLNWLMLWLKVLDERGEDAIILQQFEYLVNTENPRLYAIRHSHSELNERYIYVCINKTKVILLTAFQEKSTTDYRTAIVRAANIYNELEEDDESVENHQ